MIDIDKLRRLAQSATPNVGHACKYQDHHWLREGHVDFENADLFVASERPQEDAAFYAAANPTVILELLDRLEAAESEALEEARLNGMGSEREAALMAKLEAAEKERETDERRIADLMADLNRVGHENDALRAKITEMEKQGPAYWGPKHAIEGGSTTVIVGKFPVNPTDAPLYALPGAQPAPSVPMDVIADYLVSISAHLARRDDAKAQAEIGELLKMIAAAPKPEGE